MLMLGLPLCFLCFVTGLVGLYILNDGKAESAVSRTEFARLYKKIIAMNMMLQPLLVNGCGIGCVMIVARLREHRRAVQALALSAGGAAAVVGTTRPADGPKED